MIRPRLCQHCSVNNPPASEACIDCRHPLGDAVGLFLHEELLLFALDDESGAINGQSGLAYKYGLAGGVLTELLLAEHLHLDDRGKHPLVDVVRGPTPMLTDPLIAEVYETIRAHGKPRKLSDWVSKVGGIRHIDRRIAAPLCEMGILENRETEHGFLFFRYTRHRYPLLDPTAEYAAVNRVRKAIHDRQQRPDERTCLLVALANAGRLLGVRFSKADLKEHKQRIENITAENGIAAAVQSTVAAIETAIIVATTSASAAAAASG